MSEAPLNNTIRQFRPGQTRFTVYHNEVFNLACGRAVISYWWNKLEELTIAMPRHSFRALEIEEQDGLWNTVYLQHYD